MNSREGIMESVFCILCTLISFQGSHWSAMSARLRLSRRLNSLDYWYRNCVVVNGLIGPILLLDFISLPTCFHGVQTGFDGVPNDFNIGQTGFTITRTGFNSALACRVRTGFNYVHRYNCLSQSVSPLILFCIVLHGLQAPKLLTGESKIAFIMEAIT